MNARGRSGGRDAPPRRDLQDLAASAERLAADARDAAFAAPRAAQTRIGRHGRRAVGAGYDFWQYRPYAPGDAASEVDWRRSARGDDLLVRERERETASGVGVWTDPSASMDWRGGGAETKRDAAARLVLAVAELAGRAGETVRVLGASGRAASGRGCARRLAEIETPESPFDAPPGDAMLVIASDFLFDLAPLASFVDRAAAGGAAGALVHVRDPHEIDFPYAGRVRFEDAEGGPPALFGSAGTVADAYRRAVARHAASLDDIASASGWERIAISTAEPPAAAFERVLAGLAGLAERR